MRAKCPQCKGPTASRGLTCSGCLGGAHARGGAGRDATAERVMAADNAAPSPATIALAVQCARDAEENMTPVSRADSGVYGGAAMKRKMPAPIAGTAMMGDRVVRLAEVREPDYASAVGRDASGANTAGGLKFSIGKPRPSLFPVIVFWHIVLVLTFGAAKYTRDGVPGDNNWQKNSPADYVDALERHIAEWKMGRTADPESGYHPLAHAAVSLIFVLWFELTGNGSKQ